MGRLKEERDLFFSLKEKAEKEVREKQGKLVRVEQELGLTQKDVSRLNNDNIELRRKVEGREGEMNKLRQSEKLAVENEK